MTLDDLIKIRESLAECDPDVEVFNWGPTYEFAKRRKQAALNILDTEIKKLRSKQCSVQTKS